MPLELFLSSEPRGIHALKMLLTQDAAERAGSPFLDSCGVGNGNEGSILTTPHLAIDSRCSAQLNRIFGKGEFILKLLHGETLVSDAKGKVDYRV